MKTTTHPIEKEYIFEEIFPFLVEHGLEGISIREMCRGTGVARASLYYWFEDKASIICQATEYGLKKVMDEIFEYAFANFSDLRGFFSNCLDEIDKHREELRFAYQLATSPLYGERIRRDGMNFKFMYDKYTNRLAQIMQCDAEILQPLVYLFISAVLDYIIRQDRDISQIQLEFIYTALSNVMGTVKR